MKKITHSILFILVTLSNIAFSQTLVSWYGKVNFADLSDYNKHIEKYLNPIWDNQVEKGNIISYKVLNHSWGDEWSVVVHYEAENLNTFQDAWSAALKEYTDKTPKNERNKYFRMLIDHKDNIYSVRHSKSKK